MALSPTMLSTPSDHFRSGASVCGPKMLGRDFSKRLSPAGDRQVPVLSRPRYPRLVPAFGDTSAEPIENGLKTPSQEYSLAPTLERVEAEDAEMKISEWVSRKRKLRWMARFEAEIAKHSARMISRPQNIADCE